MRIIIEDNRNVVGVNPRKDSVWRSTG
jgi:hypothetical protein